MLVRERVTEHHVGWGRVMVVGVVVIEVVVVREIRGGSCAGCWFAYSYYNTWHLKGRKIKNSKVMLGEEVINSILYLFASGRLFKLF